MATDGRTLVVEVNWIGDVLLSTPVIRALARHRPEHKPVCLVHSRCETLLRRNPHVGALVVFDEEAPPWSRRGWAAALARLRGFGLRRAILLHASRTKGALCRAAGISEVVAYGVKPNPFLTRTVGLPADGTHRADRYLGLLEAIGVPADGRQPDYVPAPEAAAQLDRLLADEGVRAGEPVAAVHAGGNWELKRWPETHFVEWIRLFAPAFSGKIVLCGTRAEEPLCRRILSAFPAGSGIVSVSGRTSLDMLAHLFARAKVVVTNDSGPIHLAASQHARILGLFGPTSAAQTGPTAGTVRILSRNVGCEIPCYYRSCAPRACMEWIRPDEAARAALELVGDAR